MDKVSANEGVVVRNDGDAAATLAGAATKLEAIYQVPFLAHTTMEPVNCTVHVRKDGCDVWVGSQVLARAQAVAAQITGLPLDKVAVHNHLLGGGFGRRLEVDFIAQAVKIAIQVDGPVKIIWTREEDIQHDMYRPYFYDRMAAGLDADGKPVAWTHRICGSSIIARWAPPAFIDGFDFDTVDGSATLLMRSRTCGSTMCSTSLRVSAPRSGGVSAPSHNIFVVESFIDELAAAAKQDPVEYRLALLDKSPRAAGRAQARRREGRLGPGAAAGQRPRRVAFKIVFGTFMAQVAEVEVSKDGELKVKRITCAVDCGIAINPNTIEAQVQSAIVYGLTAALYGEITLKDGRVAAEQFPRLPGPAPQRDASDRRAYRCKARAAPGGMGEPGTSALPPAVTNAIFAATGVRLRKLPIDPAKLKT